jgi:putative transposase
MARLARCTVPGYPHHVVQRGNYEQNIFGSDDDYRYYLSLLKECADRYAVAIWAYCLMPNHVHVICVPKEGVELARAFNTLHMRYAQYFNGKRSLKGHLWRARFMSCILDDQSVREEVRFIENNPVRTHLVERAEDYPWSSAIAHTEIKSDSVLANTFFLREEISDWRAYLEGAACEALIGRVRSRLKTGRPAGDRQFVKTLEGIVGRRLEASPRGRPRNAGPDRIGDK